MTMRISKELTAELIQGVCDDCYDFSVKYRQTEDGSYIYTANDIDLFSVSISNEGYELTFVKENADLLDLIHIAQVSRMNTVLSIFQSSNSYVYH